jgi:TRAP-type C4-dicarboxylate transport system permease small subunit
MKFLVVFDAIFRHSLGIACAGLLLVMLGSIGGQVFMRYVLNAPWHWSEELARYSMVWMAMLGAALAARHRMQIALNDLLPLRGWRLRALSAAVTLIALAILALLFWYSWVVFGRVSRQTMAALRISMSYAYGALPAGFLLMMTGTLLALVLPDAAARTSAQASGSEGGAH